jgi:preprotein translocase YajC subunit
VEPIFWITILLLIMAGYYSLVVFPKQREFIKHQKFVKLMRVGDEVITSGGILGVITELDIEDGIAKVEIAPGVHIRIITAAVRHFDPVEIGLSVQKALGIEKSGSKNQETAE